MNLNRRNILFSSAVVAGAAFAPRIVFAQAAAPAGPFKLDPLPYANNALEPHIDARTMELHHDRHHQAFVTNLNNLAKDNSKIGSTPIHELLAKMSDVPESARATIRNSGGGHANHSMFWQIMGPGGGKPDGEVVKAIESDLGGVEKMQETFNGAGGRVFGSGWVFVIVDKAGKLAIETRPNQDSPIMDGKMVLFGNDVWEHAYYLNYQNRRPDYLKAWWNTVNWKVVADRYAQAKAGKLTI